MSIKDSEPAISQRPCSGDRFGGFYAGATVGMTNLNSGWKETFADFVPDYQDTPLKTTRSGGSGGLTLGYNRVRCNFLLGVEGDFNFASIHGSTDLYPNQAALAGPGFARISDGMRDYATLRARMGVVADRTLFFATAGLAWANLQHRLEDMGHFNGGVLVPDPNFSGWKHGWTVGGGFETALTERVSLKGEALYMDFGKREYSFADFAVPPDVYNFQARQNAVTARIGLNVMLGQPAHSYTAVASDCPGGASPNAHGVCPLK